MTYEYCIISVDDTRHDNKMNIRSCVTWPEAKIDYVDGRIPSELKKAKHKWNQVDTPGPFKSGEFGVFFSILNVFEYGAENNGILYFEDDAIVLPGFQERIDSYVNDLPNTADMFAVWSPANQRADYDCIRTFNNVGEPQYGSKVTREPIFDYGHRDLCYLWQGYGNVSMLFTKKGCQKALNYIREKGFFSPVDCLICIAVHSGRLSGYALKPTVKPLLDYDWNRPTTVQKSRWGMIDELMEEI